MSDRATLLRLLRELEAADRTEKIFIVEEAIVKLFDAVREELNNDNDRLTKELADMTADRDSERRWANDYQKQVCQGILKVDALTAELEAEQFAHWQTNQALATAQQEETEMHALNLYDLVGDADTLRDEMVSTIKERNALREHVKDSRIKLGIEIANIERQKIELQASIEENQNLIRQNVELLNERNQLRKALTIIMDFQPEDELGPMTEEYWSPEYRAAMNYARKALAEGVP